jgi:hypothetical protein
MRGNVLAKLRKNADSFSGWFISLFFHTPILNEIGGQSLLLF